MKIKVFIESARDFHERQLLMKFSEGIERYYQTHEKPDDLDISIDLSETYTNCDVALFFGSWKNREKGHHITRTSIASNSKCFICIETPLLNRKVSESNQYFRIGVNGFLNNQGIFLDPLSPINRIRLEKFGVNFSGWKNNPNGHILVLLQLPNDASLRGANIYSWAEYAIKEIRTKSQKKIVIRPHPLAPLRSGEEFYDFFFRLHKEKISNIEFSDPSQKSLAEDLNGAYCSVAYSSGSSIDSVINGIPAITCDAGNFMYDISTHFPDEIEHLRLASPQEVDKLLTKLAYYQWTENEIHSGQVWDHLLPIINNVLTTIRTNIENTKRKK